VKEAKMQQQPTSTITELRKNALAALAMLGVITGGALLVAALFGAH
jgi:hypothetical protein